MRQWENRGVRDAQQGATPMRRGRGPGRHPAAYAGTSDQEKRDAPKTQTLVNLPGVGSGIEVLIIFRELPPV